MKKVKLINNTVTKQEFKCIEAHAIECDCKLCKKFWNEK